MPVGSLSPIAAEANHTSKSFVIVTAGAQLTKLAKIKGGYDGGWLFVLTPKGTHVKVNAKVSDLAKPLQQGRPLPELRGFRILKAP